MHGLQVRAYTAKITDSRDKKIPIQFVKFPSHDIQMLWVGPRKIMSCVLEETNHNSYIKFILTKLFKELTEEEKL